MNTITAKELRDNLDQIVKRVRRGEPIRVTYRSKAAFTLQPEKPSGSLLPGSAEAMKKFLEEARKLRYSKKHSVFDSNKSAKELYHELLDNDPKYKPHYHR
jgi:prevent-host-death family protein